MKIYLTLAAAVLALSACNNTEDTAAPAADTASKVDAAMPAEETAMVSPTDAAGYIAKAGAGDLWEIESSKALLSKSTNAEVKKFAQMMVDHHTDSTEKVKAAAMAANLTVAPPKLAPDQEKTLEEVKKANANAIDALYVRHQKTAHDAALALHQGFATGGDTEALKNAAGEIAPVVQKHIAELGKLSAG